MTIHEDEPLKTERAVALILLRVGDIRIVWILYPEQKSDQKCCGFTGRMAEFEMKSKCPKPGEGSETGQS